MKPSGGGRTARGRRMVQAAAVRMGPPQPGRPRMGPAAAGRTARQADQPMAPAAAAPTAPRTGRAEAAPTVPRGTARQEPPAPPRRPGTARRVRASRHMGRPATASRARPRATASSHLATDPPTPSRARPATDPRRTAPATGPPASTPRPAPGIIPLRPLSFADYFSGAFGYIRANPVATLVPALVMAVVAQLVQLRGAGRVGRDRAPSSAAVLRATSAARRRVPGSSSWSGWSSEPCSPGCCSRCCARR